ncbi:MAG: hypothetical protein AAFO94_05695 [Bacteroidota bacterium]
MNRFNWTYIDHKNERHIVGLMHGAESGNLLVYCNTDIVLIDFKILESKTYSFFIDEELCELSIERKGDQYLYSFDIDREADTPLNRMRKKLNRKYLHQSLAFLGVFILMVLSFTIGFNYWNNNNSRQQLAYLAKANAKGKETVARIAIEKDSDGQLITYFFVADGKNYTFTSQPSEDHQKLLSTGMPLEGGDEFVVKYAATNPQVNEIDYSRPSVHQLSVYKKRAIDQHLKYHPELDVAYCSCVADVAFEKKGLGGLADLYFQRVADTENTYHNIESYKKLVRSPDFIEQVEEQCWEK